MGFALFFHNFSTFLGKPGIYLEDLFVRPEARGRGVGQRLLAWLARTALERGCATARLGGTRLERTLDRLLPQPGCRGARGVDHVPAQRRGAASAWPGAARAGGAGVCEGGR